MSQWFFDLASSVDYFRRCSALDTAGLRQPSAQDKQTNGEQIQESSKLFELYLIFESNLWHDLIIACFLRVIPPCM